MVCLCRPELALSSNWPGWSGSLEFLLQGVVIASGVVLISHRGCFACVVFRHSDKINWKEKVTENYATKIGGYKQVSSKGHVSGCSW